MEPITTDDMAKAITTARDVCEKEGIDLRLLVRGWKEELKAREPKFFQKDGKVTAKRTVVNVTARQNARRELHKLRGDYPVETKKVEFPDENGRPQKIGGGIFTDMERATRLLYLLQQAEKRTDDDGSSE